MVKANGEHTIESTKIKDGPLLPAQRFELKTWLQSCVVRWDGASTAGKGGGKGPTVADKVFDLLLAYPQKQFTVNDICTGIGEKNTAVTNALNRLLGQAKVQRIAATGKRSTWVWQLGLSVGPP
jgi:hypothetical protein